MACECGRKPVSSRCGQQEAGQGETHDDAANGRVGGDSNAENQGDDACQIETRDEAG
jgi:hypothetical protein